MIGKAALAAGLLLLVPVPLWAQATLKQLGPVAPQHLAMYAGNGEVMDAGGIAMPGGPPTNDRSPGTRPSGLGIVNPRLGYAAFSGYANGNYAELLFGFTEGGDGLIKLDRVGDDAPLVLYCEINHVRQPCSGVTTVSIRPGTGLSSSPDPITGTGEIWLKDTAVQPGLYPYASVTVDQQGRIIDIAAGSIPPDPTPPGDPDGSLQYNCAGIFCGASVATGLEFSGGNLALTQVFNDQSSGGYTILTGDGGKTIEAGAHTYTLPQAGTAGFEEHWGTCLLNISGGDATINTTISVFSGAGGGTSLTLHPGDWACPSSDGTNYPTLAGSGTGSGLGTVTIVNTGTGLTGGPITTTGTIALEDTAVTPGSYTYASLTVDQQGRLTAAGNGAAPPSAANPTATAGPVAVNGSASTFMRSDGAPPVQKASAAQFGIVEVDGSTITETGGVISSVGASGANPTATAKDTVVNGVATTFMRSDGAPAVQKATSSQFGIVEVDGTSITASGGVISSVGASSANPTGTAGPVAVNGSASTFMRADAAPAVQKGSAAQFGIVQVDGTSITASGGVISSVGASGANPTATASDTAVNGVATTFMRSDGAPAIQKGLSSQFGIVKVDGTSITSSSGIITAALPTAANPTATAGASAVNGSAATFMRSDAAPAVQAASTSTAGIAKIYEVPLAIGWPTAVDPNKNIIATINQASTVTAIVGTVDTAVGSSATVSVYKAGSGTACSAGTVLHSGSFDANGTAATNQTLTVTTSSLSAGDRLCLVTTGGANWTGGTGIGGITVFVKAS